jgi:hypothetical protein
VRGGSAFEEEAIEKKIRRQCLPYEEKMALFTVGSACGQQRPRTTLPLLLVAAGLILPRIIIAITLPERASAFTLVLPSSVVSRASKRCPSLKDKWDDWVEEDDDEDDDSIEARIPPDMRYVPRIVARSARNYRAIREAAGGPGLCADVYARAPRASSDEGGRGEEGEDEDDVFWFVGKVARVSDVSLERAVARQWPLVQRHAGNLRPLELWPSARRLDLELWCAPGDSELDVAYNRPDCAFTKMSQAVPGADRVRTNQIGFQGEVYQGREEGFRTWRFVQDGRPSRPEVKGPATETAGVGSDEDEEQEYRAPTDAELEKIQKALEGKDLNQVYEEQQRRKQQQREE